MATASFNGIVSNTGEDFVDELISNMVYGETNSFMKEVKQKMDLKEDSYLDQAIESALSTFQYGLMNAVIIVVTEYAITKTSLILLGLIAYIKGRSFVQKSKTSLQSLFSRVGSKGGAVGKAVGALGRMIVGKQEETLATAKMMNDSANNVVTNVSLERQNQILLRNQQAQRVDATRANMYSVRNKSRDKNMTLFVWKTTNGMWEKTQKDEKLYFSCVGSDSVTVPFNKEFVDKLNSLADVVKTAKGEIISRTKASVDMLTAMGANVKG